MNFITNQELLIRICAFAVALLLLLTWEAFRPRRVPCAGKWLRRINNLLLVMVDAYLLRLLGALASVGAAALASRNQWGIFHLFPVPYWAAFVFSIIILDLVIYAQHVLFHKVGILWRIHRVHHTDRDFDVTTALRFHPFEILLSACIKFAAVVVLGAPLPAVLLFEILLNVCSMFNHSNVAIPAGTDRWLRLIIVTPDMHRVHHSVIRRETDSNYGFNLPWWDRLFRTYRPQPRDGHEKMTIGLKEFAGENTVNVLRLLVQPFFNVNRSNSERGE